MALIFIVGETARRGLDYFSLNATTMFEDYISGVFLLSAAAMKLLNTKGSQAIMVAAWAYDSGGMFVPFFAHLEAWIRGITMRPDHPHEDLNSVILKGIIWSICLTCLVSTIKDYNSLNKTKKATSS